MTGRPDTQAVVERDSSANLAVGKSIRVAFLTNVIAPYWKPVFDSLSNRYPALRILLSTRMESNRPWDADWRGLDVVLQKTITINRRWRHPKGFDEPLYVHLPIDTWPQLKRFRPDLVISNEMGFRSLLAAVYSKLHSEVRLVLWADVSESTEHGRGTMRLWLRRFLRKRADAIVVLGESGARYIRSLGTPEHQIFRVPYTTDVDRFAACSVKRSAERAWRLLYVGQLIERKGLLQWTAALSRWAAANPGRTVEFVLAGAGPLRSRLETQAVPPNLIVRFLGNLPYAELAGVYADSGVFVFPTLADTWGVAVNEALASGLPVLGSVYSQAVEELVEEGRNGWLFHPDQADELYGALDRCMNLPLNELEAMRKHARVSAVELTPIYAANRIDDIVTAVCKVPS